MEERTLQQAYEDGYKAGASEVLQEVKRLLSAQFEGITELGERLLGVAFTSETKAYKRAVLCVETGVRYSSLSEASRDTGISRSQINKVCLKMSKRKTAGGYHWTYTI